jgi:hypothetical protein
MSVVPDLVPPHLRPGAPAERDQPVITGLGLSLRPWQPSDAPLLVRAYSVPDIRHWHGRSMEDGEGEAWICERAARWRAEAGADWAVAADRQVQGRAGLRWISLADGSAEVSYWVLPEARRRQVANQRSSSSAGGPCASWACTGSSSCTQPPTRHRAGSLNSPVTPSKGSSAMRPGIQTAGTTCTCTRVSPPTRTRPDQSRHEPARGADTRLAIVARAALQ